MSNVFRTCLGPNSPRACVYGRSFVSARCRVVGRGDGLPRLEAGRHAALWRRRITCANQELDLRPCTAQARQVMQDMSGTGQARRVMPDRSCIGHEDGSCKIDHAWQVNKDRSCKTAHECQTGVSRQVMLDRCVNTGHARHFMLNKCVKTGHTGLARQVRLNRCVKTGQARKVRLDRSS